MKETSGKPVLQTTDKADAVLKFKRKLDLQNSAIKKLTATLAIGKKNGLAIALLCLSFFASAQTFNMTWVHGDSIPNLAGAYGNQNENPYSINPSSRRGATKCTDKDGNVWLFGGYGRDSDGFTGYMNDLWKWDGESWSWIAGNDGVNVKMTSTRPGGVTSAVSWVDDNGYFWLFGGYGYSTSHAGHLGDLWRYNGIKWKKMKGPGTRDTEGAYPTTKNSFRIQNMPGCRRNATVWRDDAGDVWLFGGQGYGSAANTEGELNDLWKWNGTQWAWISGSMFVGTTGSYGTKGVAASTNTPGSRYAAANWIDGSDNLWLRGGYGKATADTLGFLNDLWKWNGSQWTWVAGNDTINSKGVYGTKGSASASNIPGARSNSANTIYSDGAVYLFGGAGYDAANKGLLSDLWKWDGTHWTWLSGANSVGDAVNFGALGVSSSTSKPYPYLSAHSWMGSDGKLYLFGGTNDTDAVVEPISYTGDSYNTLWNWDGANWTWINGDSAAWKTGYRGPKGGLSFQTPGSRTGASSWASGDGTWLYGGYGYDKDSSEGWLNDLWKWDGHYWTWVWGFSTKNNSGVYSGGFERPAPREFGATWTDASGNLWLFGGYGRRHWKVDGYYNDLWKWDGTKWVLLFGNGNADLSGVYTGTNARPGSRSRAQTWTDGAGNLWLFGGKGYDKNGDLGRLSDLWKWDGTEWTFLGGSNTVGQSGVHGTLGDTSITNWPGARSSGMTWMDDDENLWLFGGGGFDKNGAYGYLNDLWKWDGTHWTWMGGSATKSASGVYGTKNTASATNIPGSRSTGAAWKDDFGIVWLLGGYGADKNGNDGRLNDLWKYEDGQWTWMNGSDTENPVANYGDLDKTAINNISGGRSAATLLGTGNKRWLFGGSSRNESNTSGTFNDVWELETDVKIENGGANAVSFRYITISATETPGSALQDVGDYFKVVEASGDWVEQSVSIIIGSDVDKKYERYWVFEKNDIGENGGMVQIEFDLGELLSADYSYFLLNRYGYGYQNLVTYGYNYKLSGTKVIFTIDIKDIKDNYQYQIGRSKDGPVYCVDFDGVNDYIEVNALSPQLANKSATIEGWFISENDDDALFAINTASGADKCVLYRNKYWDITYNAAYSFPNPVADNKWHHFAVVINSETSVTVYIDGKQESLLPSGSMLLAADDLISIGQAFNGSSKAEFLSGQVDEVRIWKDQRTLKEIHDNMYRTLVGDESGLLAYYKCDQATNVHFPDYSKNGYSGLLKNFSMSGYTSKYVPSTAPIVKSSLSSAIIGPGGALLFDGNDDRIETTLDAQPSAMATTTWEAWIYPQELSASGYQAILSTDDSGYDRTLVFRPGKAKLSVYLGNTGSGLWTPDATLSEDKWTHVAVVYTPSNTFLYIDGIEFEYGSGATGQTTTSDLFIGSNVYEHDFKGKIDEVRIWDDRRTQTEIQDNMHRALSTSEANLVAYYTFDQASGSVLEDQVSNNDGTLNNFPGSYLPWVSAAGREPFKTINSGNYALAENWKGGVAPSGTTDQLAIFHDLTINGNATYDRLLVSSNTELKVNKSIDVTGDVVVNGTCVGTNNIILSGSAEQCLAGSGTIGRLRVENSTGVSLEGDLTVSEKLTLIDGDIKINHHTLTLTGTTSHGSDTSYLKMNGTGKVKATVGSDPVILPIGRNPYLPIIIDDGGDAEYTVGLTNKVYANPESETNEQTGDVVSETWTIQSSSAVNDVIITIQWDGAEEEAGFNKNAAHLSFWESGVSSFWEVESPTTATGSGPYSLSQTTDLTTNLYYFGIGSEGSALPVEMTYFDAEWVISTTLNDHNSASLSHRALLTWETSVEINNSHFEIERAIANTDTSTKLSGRLSGMNWQTIGQAQGQGTVSSTTEYRFIDPSLEAQNATIETIYYRLKQVDFSGQFEYSPIRTLHTVPEALLPFNLWPNPTTGNELFISQVGNYTVYSSLGILLSTHQQVQRIDISTLARGSYFIKDQLGTCQTFVRQ